MNARNATTITMMAFVALGAGRAFAWGAGHDTVARCLLRRLPPELASRMTPEWMRIYEEASHLPDAGSPELLAPADREALKALGWTGGLELHENPLRFAIFDRLVAAIRRDDAYSQFVLLAALSHVNADPAASNHNPFVQYVSMILTRGGLGIFSVGDTDFAVVETTPAMRAVMDSRLADIPEPVLPEHLAYRDCYARLLRLEWDSVELCNGRGCDVAAYAAARKAGDAEAEEKLAEALCDLGMYAVEETLWFYAAAQRLAEEGAEPPADFDAKAFVAEIEAEKTPAFARRPLGADGHLRPYLPEPGVRYDVQVLADPLAHMDNGVMSPASRILAPQAVCSLRHVRPDLASALVDIRDVLAGKMDPSATRLLVVFGEKMESYVGFDAEGLKAAVAAYAEKGGKVLWVNGAPPKGLADGLAAAMIEPNPNPGTYCNERYWVPQRELAGTTLAWTDGRPAAYSYERRPTGMAGWYWEGSHVAFDPAKLPEDARALMTFSSPALSCVVGVAAPKEEPTFAYLPTAAFFPYVLTREKPSPTRFELRFDSAGEAFLRRAVDLLLPPERQTVETPEETGAADADNPTVANAARNPSAATDADKDGKAAVASVAGPDHMHAHDAMLALRDGRKALVASPAARTVEETRILFAEAAKHPGSLAIRDLGPVADADRETVGKVRAFGNVTSVEVGCRTEMPYLGTARPPKAEAIPDWYAWENWTGVMAPRPFYRLYVEDEGWRAFLDFGTGPLGKDGARLLRPVFLALGLGVPEYAERLSVDGASPDRETYPKAALVRFVFRGGIELFWRHGPDVETAVTWRNDQGETLVTMPSVPVPEGEQLAALERGEPLPPEAEAVTEMILVGCRAMMSDRRVTAGDCERRYVRDGWEW